MSNIVRRSVTSVSWNVVAQGVTVAVGFARSILLARLLNVETFGIYAGALAIVGITGVLPNLGLSSALIHHAPETEDEEHAAAVYLGIQSLAVAVWAAVLVTFALWTSAGPSRTALIVVTLCTAVEILTSVVNALYVRRVDHRRPALIATTNIVVVSIVTVLLAWWGAEIWTLLAGEILTAVILTTGFFLWRPIWRARWAWDRGVAAYYLRFGLPAMGALLLENTIQRVDDLFVRYRLGVREMGFYSRAYTFASYPRGILSAPVTLVAGGTFAALADNRLQLSKAFFRTAALLVRAGFLFAGWLILIAPEFVLLLLGAKWLPMVPIFRLMSVFALIDPLRDLLTSVYVAVGQPRRLMTYKFIQLAVLLVGLLVLGSRWGTVGVALAVDLMLLLGIGQLLVGARRWVDFSPLRLFGAPLLALVVALAAAFALEVTWGVGANLWLLALGKTLVFGAIFGGLLWLLEGRTLLSMWAELRRQMRRSAPPLEPPPDPGLNPPHSEGA